MHHREKRDNIKAEMKEYTIIRVLKEHPDYYMYICTRNNKMHTIREYKSKERYMEEVENIRLLNKMDINVPELEAVNENEKIIIREYLPGLSVCDLLMKGELDWSHLQLIRTMALRFEDCGLSLDYFPTNFIICENDVFYTGAKVYLKNDDNGFDNVGAKFFLYPSTMIAEL